MTSQDINIILSEIRSAREAGDEARLTLRFMQLPAELRAEFAEFAGVECDEDGEVDKDTIRSAIKAACELDALSGNTDVFAMLDAALAQMPKWRRVFEAPYLGHYVAIEEIDPNDYPATLVLGEEAHWIEPCEHGDEGRLDAPTWDADEGAGTLVVAYPVRGGWTAWGENL
jgi:hypothetical protein